MALFKILRGQRINLKSHAITDGYAYVTLDEHNMYIDSGTDTRFKLGDKESTPFIVGTQTTVTNKWTGNASSIDVLFDGLTIRYQLPYSNSGDATLNLILSDGTSTGEIECYFSNIFRLNNEYPAGTILTLTYRKAVSISGTVYTGWWINNSGFTAMDASGNLTTTIGGSHKPIYLSDGILKQVDFSLNATVQDGTANTLAYYSSADTISSNTNIFVYSNKMAIGADNKDYNLYVEGNSYITSNLSIGTYNQDYNLFVDGNACFNGLVNLASNKNEDNYTGALNLNDSNIYGVNALFISDLTDSAKKGLQWYRTSTTVDTMWVKNGVMYFTPNRTLGAIDGTSYIIPFGNFLGVGTNGLSILQLNPNGALVTSNRNEGDISTPLYLKAGVLTTVKHPAAGDWFTGVPVVYSDGVTALGRYLDFHPEGASTLDYHIRIDTGDDVTQRIFTFGSTGGEFVTHAATTQIGDTNLPIYINASGQALPLTISAGIDGKTLVFFNNGIITASTATEGGSAHPVYLKDGTLTGLSGHIGDINTPVYIDNGTIKTTGKTFTSVVPSGESEDTTFPSSKAVWSAIANGITANDAMVFKGTIGLGGTVTELPAIHYTGWTYRVISVGYYAGQVCEVGDLITCLTDGVVDDDSHWTVAQSNIDGAIVTPSGNRTVGGTARPIYVNNGVATQIDYTIGASIPQGMATSMLYYNATNSLTTISTANGALYATEENGTPIWGTLPVAQGGTGATEPFAARENLGFNVRIPNTTTDSGWHMIDPALSTTESHSAFILKSIRTQANAPSWVYDSYSSGIAFGGDDTKGVLSVPYNANRAGLRIAGGNGTKPKWYFTISATSGNNYIMSTAGGYVPTSVNRQAGGTQQPIYVDSNGVIQQTTYALKASVLNGLTGRLAYYQNNRAVSYSENLSYNKQTSTAATPATLTIFKLWGPTYGDTADNLLSNTAGVFQYGDGGPQIQFSSLETDGQSGALIFTDNDAAGQGVSWHFVSDQDDWSVSSKRFVAKTSVTIGANVPNTDYGLFVQGDTRINGPLSIQSNKGGFREGIRIYPYSNWSDIVLLGSDSPDITGITANSWFIGNNNGNFYINRGGSQTPNPVQLSCINNTWNITGATVFKSSVKIQYNSSTPAFLTIQTMSPAANASSILYFGNKDKSDAAYIQLNGNTMSIKNNIGDLTLDNNTIVNGTITASQLIGNAATATQLYTPRILTIGASGKAFDGSANVSWSPYEMRLTRALYNTDQHLNAFADRGSAIGMLNLTGTDPTVNPNKGTGWHHVFQATWVDCRDNNGSTGNQWCSQIVVQCGTDQWYVRSRAGGAIVNGTAWKSNWRHLVTSSVGAVGSKGQPVYINGSGEAEVIDWHVGNASLGEHNANNITYNMIGYYTANGPHTDPRWDPQLTYKNGGIYSQGYSSAWVTQMAQSYVYGELFIRSKKGNEGWQPWEKVIDTRNMKELFTSLYWTDGTVVGPTLNAVIGGTGLSAIIPSASIGKSGIVTTEAQSFAGEKTFSNATHFNENVNIGTGKAILFAESVGDTNANTPTALSHGRLQSQGKLSINADTDNSSSSEQVVITAGHGMSDNPADGLSIGADSLKWKDVDVVRNTGTWNINVTGSAGSLAHVDFTKSLQLTTEWMDTGVIGSNLATGTYIIQVFCDVHINGGDLWQERYSGVMSWYTSGTNSIEADEIPLHNAGHASNTQRIFLRTLRTSRDVGTGLKLQIASSHPWTAAGNVTFKFALIISG